MSTKEIVYSLIDRLNDAQLEAIMSILNQFSIPKYNETEPRPKAGTLKGALADCANPDLILKEKEAWANAAAEKYKNFGR